MFAAILWNNPYLSLAELISVFPDAQFWEFDENILLFSGVAQDDVLLMFPKLGWTIKIIKVLPNITTIDQVGSYLQTTTEGKITFGFNFYGTGGNNLNEALWIKKILKKGGRSARAVNTKPENLGSASTIHNKLIQKKSEINIMFLNGEKYIGYTLCIQNISTYADRDTSKSRSMSVGMLPPKLAQIMINLSQTSQNTAIYDPFVGLGTILIEAAHHGYTHLLWSDIKSDLVDKTRENVRQFVDKNNLSLVSLDCFEQDATKIHELPDRLSNTAIITESYLGRLFTPRDISDAGIEKEKQILTRIYSGFFGWLQKAGYTGTIVITIPFWQMGRQKIFFKKITEIIQKYDFRVSPLLPEPYEKHLSARKTLLYSRSDQVVGREMYRVVSK